MREQKACLPDAQERDRLPWAAETTSGQALRGDFLEDGQPTRKLQGTRTSLSAENPYCIFIEKDRRFWQSGAGLP